jgi:threonine synthase
MDAPIKAINPKPWTLTLDMDAPIKAITTDAALQAEMGLCSVNSINIGRVVAQTVHFFYSYIQVV